MVSVSVRSSVSSDRVPAVPTEIFFRAKGHMLVVRDDFKDVAKAIYLEEKAWLTLNAASGPVMVQAAAIAYVQPHGSDTSLSQ